MVGKHEIIDCSVAARRAGAGEGRLEGYHGGLLPRGAQVDVELVAIASL
jgi:hypothetical protein